MGYYTSFSLTAPMPEDDLEAAQLMTDLGDAGFEEVNDNGAFVEAYVHTKWYDFEGHMRELSKLYPATLLEVDAKGEEWDDLWRCYIQNGKSQRVEAEITYAPHDPAKMEGD